MSHIYIGRKFLVDTPQRLNLHRSYDLSLIQGLGIHRNNVAFPISFVENGSVIDNDTMELKFMGRVLFALPAFLRGNLGFIIMKAEPTAEQIATAKAAMYTLSADNMTKTYQIALYDEVMNGPDVKKN